MSRCYPLGKLSYESATVPSLYHCAECGVHGVKLWRDYNTFLEHNSLLCASCACREQSRDGRKTYSVAQDERGKVCVTTVYDPLKEPVLHKAYGGSDRGGDQIGWRVPAVPTEDGENYWGYTSVPVRGCMWWNKLPLTNGAGE